MLIIIYYKVFKWSKATLRSVVLPDNIIIVQYIIFIFSSPRLQHNTITVFVFFFFWEQEVKKSKQKRHTISTNKKALDEKS